MGKQIQKGLEWDNLVWKATSAYNFFPTESSGISPFFLMFGREAAAKHMLLAEESTKYVGDNEGILNLKLMQQLYHVIAYNLAKSRTARDGNRILKRKNFKPRHLKRNGLVLVRDHTSKAFEPKAIDHHIVDFCGKNQVLVKDNYGNKKKVHVKDIKPIEMDIATAELFRKEREQCTTRDAKHVMPIKLIPDLEWEFIENISVMESDKGVTIYCIKEAEDECEDTQVTEVSEPKTEEKTTENIKSVVTETVEAPRATQTNGDTDTTEIVEPRYEHRERSNTMTEDAVPREITEKAEPTENTGISQAILVDPTEDTKVSEQAATKEIERTDTIDVTEVITGIPEPTTDVTSKKKEENMTTPPGSLQKENPEVQNNSEDTTETNAEQAVKKTHKNPETNNSLINKIFSVFRQAKESMETIPL